MIRVRVLLSAATQGHKLLDVRSKKTDVSFSTVSMSVGVLLPLRLTSNNQACVREQILGLHKGTGMARVEEVKNSISVDPHRPMSCG